MENRLDLPDALKAARKLKLIPGYPWDEETILETAEALIRWCKGTFIDGYPSSAKIQADWLVTEAIETWKRWQGIPELSELLKSKLTKPVQPGNAARDLGPKPILQCRVCKDNGWHPGESGLFEYCACEHGQTMKTEMGDRWLSMLNSSRLPGASAFAKRHGIGPSYIEAQESFREHQERVRELVATERAILADDTATRERKEIARETLRTYGVLDPEKDS